MKKQTNVNQMRSMKTMYTKSGCDNATTFDAMRQVQQGQRSPFQNHSNDKIK